MNTTVKYGPVSVSIDIDPSLGLGQSEPDPSEAYDLIDLMNQADPLVPTELKPSVLGFTVDSDWPELYHASNALVGHLIKEWPRDEPTLDDVRDGKAPIEGTPVPGIRKRVVQALTDLGVDVDDDGLSHIMHAIYNRNGASQQPNRRDTIMSHAEPGETFRVLTARGWLGDVGLHGHKLVRTLDEMVGEGLLFKARGTRYGFPPPKSPDDVDPGTDPYRLGTLVRATMSVGSNGMPLGPIKVEPVPFGEPKYGGANWREAEPTTVLDIETQPKAGYTKDYHPRHVEGRTVIKDLSTAQAVMGEFVLGKKFFIPDVERWLEAFGYKTTSYAPTMYYLVRDGFCELVKRSSPRCWRFVKPLPEGYKFDYPHKKKARDN